MLESPSMLRYSSFDEICVGYEANIGESWGSENSSAADNQQERLVKIGWITGFVDGEGCFSIHVVRQPHRSNRRGYRTGFQVAHQFVVTQGRTSVSVRCSEAERSNRNDHSILSTIFIAHREASRLRAIRSVHADHPDECSPHSEWVAANR